ncbi:hypothetical protein ACA910_003766 [Epithemia clementina (nom. ined.)]
MVVAWTIPTTITTLSRRTSSTSSRRWASPSSSSSSSQQEEAQRLLERARAMRAEIATLEGKTIDEVEAEALEKKKREQELKQLDQKQRQKQQQQASDSKSSSTTTMTTNGSFLTVPETFDDQVTQAKAAIERAYRDGITTQTVRFALLSEGESLNEDRQWPGGAQQMYRSAAGPLTRELLHQLRPRRVDPNDDHHHAFSSSSSSYHQPPVVQSKDVWDFDGSALITAEGKGYNVQALVLPNTDVKYVKDIGEMRRRQEAKQSQPPPPPQSIESGNTNDSTQARPQQPDLLLLVNPFWRNVESWGFNLLAPNAKKLAQQEIFDNGMFQETYVLLQKSVRGEDCIALKAYPYDWQLFAYADNEDAYSSSLYYYGNGGASSYLVRLGSTPNEPTAADFAQLLEQRSEFQMSKNMRQMQRMLNKNNNNKDP